MADSAETETDAAASVIVRNGNPKEEKSPLDGSSVEVDVGTRPSALDGGWGWFCVLGSAMNFMVFSLLVRSFGVTYLQLLARYQSTPTETAWVGAISMACSGLFAPLATILTNRFSCRVVSIAGGILTFVGVATTAMAPNIYVCYLTYGIIAGLGVCFGYVPGYIILGDYFEKRKATAMGVACVGNAIGLMVAPPLILYLFDTYGHQGAFIITGAICLNGSVGGALYRPIQNNFPKRKGTSEFDKPKKSKPNMCDVGLFTNIGFLGYFILMFGLIMVAALSSAFMPALAVEKGLTMAEATYALAITGICDIIGTIGLGALMDVPFVSRYKIYFSGGYSFIIALTVIFNPFLTTFVGFMLVSVIRGVCLIHLMSQRMTLLDCLVDKSRVPGALGLILLTNALGAITARSLGGLLRDSLGSYAYGFYVVGSVCAAASIFCVASYSWTRRKRMLTSSEKRYEYSGTPANDAPAETNEA